jgi:hypothetical protein
MRFLERLSQNFSFWESNLRFRRKSGLQAASLKNARFAALEPKVRWRETARASVSDRRSALTKFYKRPGIHFNP